MAMTRHSCLDLHRERSASRPTGRSIPLERRANGAPAEVAIVEAATPELPADHDDHDLRVARIAADLAGSGAARSCASRWA